VIFGSDCLHFLHDRAFACNICIPPCGPFGLGIDPYSDLRNVITGVLSFNCRPEPLLTPTVSFLSIDVVVVSVDGTEVATEGNPSLVLGVVVGGYF
jgi:hypothetical protein